MSLFHIFFDAKPLAAQQKKKEYRSYICYRDNLQSVYLDQLVNGDLSKNEYSHLLNELYIESSVQIDRINIEHKQINRDFSFNGRSSFHFWIFVFGLASALLFFSCKSLHDDISRGSTFKFQFVSLSGITISLFWIIHLIFLTQSDFQKNKYIGLIFVCAVLFTAFVFFLVKYYTYKDYAIESLKNLLVRIKDVHYKKVLTKALFAEKNGEGMISDSMVKDEANDFDKDIKQTIKALDI